MKKIRRLWAIITIFTMLVSVLAPAVVFADDAGGEVAVGNIDPVISAVALRDAGDVGAVTELDPETEYLLKFTVADDNSMYDIDNVLVEIYFGGEISDVAGEGINDYYKFTYTESTNSWACSTGAAYLSPTTSSTVPSNEALGTFAFALYFKVDGVALASGAATNDGWNVKITATDDSVASDNDISITFDVNLYKAIDGVSTVTFGAASPGDTLDEQDIDPTVSANHQLDIKLDGSDMTTTGDGPTTIAATLISYDDAANYTAPIGTLPTAATIVYDDYNQSSFDLETGDALTANTCHGGFTDGELKYLCVKGTSAIPNPLQNGSYTGIWALTIVSAESVSTA